MNSKHSSLFAFTIFSALILFGCEDNKTTKDKRDSEPPSTEMTADKALANVPVADRLNYYAEMPAMQIDPAKKYVGTIRTEKGDIVVELDALYAPLHVNNFVYLARQGFYDGLTFHRHVPGFVIQGGDPSGTGTGGPGYTVPAEIGLPHVEGALAMARRGDQVNPQKASSGSQFYITLAATHQLDGGYSVFGRVIAGLDVVMKLTQGDLILRVDIEEN